jgi:hypothetical protein
MEFEHHAAWICEATGATDEGLVGEALGGLTHAQPEGGQGEVLGAVVVPVEGRPLATDPWVVAGLAQKPFWQNNMSGGGLR